MKAQSSTAKNPNIIKALVEARANLAGHADGMATDGAIDKLAGSDPLSAIVKLYHAVTAVSQAESYGATNLSQLKKMLTLTAEAIAQEVYLSALAVVGTPSPGQASQLQRINELIHDGHIRLIGTDYLGAIDQFKAAVGRTLELL